MRHPSWRSTPIFLACSVSSPSPMASQRMRFPYTTPLQSKRISPARPSSCVHLVHSTRRRSPKPSLPGKDRARDAELRLLAALSFLLLTTNLSDPLFGDVLGALEALACAGGFLALPTPRDAVLTTLAKAALPPRVVAALPCLARGVHTQLRRGWRRRRAATTAGAQPTQSGMRARSRRCCALPRGHAMPQLVHSARGAPQCGLRPHHARHRSAGSCFTEHRRGCWYTDQAWCSGGRRAGADQGQQQRIK
jgi:hypothetical protein